MRKTRFNPDKFHFNQIPMYLVLVPLALFMALPIVFIINHAFKPIDELFAFPPRFFVENPVFDNFVKLARQASAGGISISRYIFNSVIVTGSVVFLSMIISSMAAFALSKLRFRAKGILMEINNLAMMFVPVAVIIPRYLLVEKMGIINTYFAHILPLIALPVGMFLVKQFTDQVPDSLIEAAVVDGANYFTVYRKIILPMIKPAIATVAILAFQSVWNNTETSAMYTNKESMRTLTFYMNTLASNTNAVAGQGIAAAASLIMFLPNLILFILCQSKVMNTMAHSGIK
ncbi:MAG: carbohydrate ABC transporter permease [Clostridia bacterium]|nr:carbohydrate ABC transporter permease [Clostridia bacterium]MBQ4619806.1 carbohydrate ABC transporter permease [Clostridia bacterium]MBQ9856296.1 carbohydrate ABC transporter permease [Clostridia bacterium]